MKILKQAEAERALVRTVAARWNSAYAAGQYGEKLVEFGRRLAALDPETATADDVDAIIGNDNWCRIEACNECGARAPLVLHLGEEPDYGSATFFLCGECLSTAVALYEQAASATPPDASAT